MDKTLTKGLSIIEFLASDPRPKGVSDISRALELSKSNTHRLLQTLVALGYANSAEGRYSLTPKVCSVSAAVIDGFDVRRLALPEIERLASATRETVHVSVPDYLDVVYIEKIDSPQPMCAHTRIGGRAPAYCVSTGKALLAFQPGEVIAEVRKHLVRHTEHTVTDPEDFDSELAKIRKAGYALNRGEWHIEIGGVAAPVFDANAAVVAAIGVSGPTARLTQKVLRNLAPLVSNAARSVSLQMGATLGANGVPPRFAKP